MSEADPTLRPDWRSRASGGWDDASRDDIMAVVPEKAAIRFTLDYATLAKLHKYAREHGMHRAQAISTILRERFDDG